MKKFPDHFIFGVGDADLQVIGERHTLKAEASLPTMWTHCAAENDRVYQSETPLEGVDRYHRWKEDIDLIAGLGVRHYRTSISMSRILKRDGSVNKGAIQWYRNYFSALKEKGISVYATLYHWELPLFLHEMGGWKSRDSIEWLVKHALTVARELDQYIDEYFIINEHICIAFLGYYEALHAPFERNLASALQAAHHLLVAQGEVFRALKKERPKAKVGTVYNLCPVYSVDTGGENLAAQKNFNGLFMDWLLEPVFTGRYPENIRDVMKDYLPKMEAGDEEKMRIGAELSTLGINYYFGQTVCADSASPIGAKVSQPQFQIRTGLGWPVYVPPVHPSGLYDLLVRTHARYELQGLKRIMITENGTSWPDTEDDQFRIDYLNAHLEQIWNAMRIGVPVAGYFCWTLLDNYEWQEGYRPESAFGLVHVDRATLKRTPKKSYAWYRDMVKRRSL